MTQESRTKRGRVLASMLLTLAAVVLLVCIAMAGPTACGDSDIGCVDLAGECNGFGDNYDQAAVAAWQCDGGDFVTGTYDCDLTELGTCCVFVGQPNCPNWFCPCIQQ